MPVSLLFAMLNLLSYIGSRVLSFKQPLLSVDMSTCVCVCVCEGVCVCVCVCVSVQTFEVKYLGN